MDLDIVAGTYDCMIKGFSIDVVAPEEKVRLFFCTSKWVWLILLKMNNIPALQKFNYCVYKMDSRMSQFWHII